MPFTATVIMTSFYGATKKSLLFHTRGRGSLKLTSYHSQIVKPEQIQNALVKTTEVSGGLVWSQYKGKVHKKKQRKKPKNVSFALTPPTSSKN